MLVFAYTKIYCCRLCFVEGAYIIGFENVYVNVLMTKCMPMLFYGIDCLHGDCNALYKLSGVWNTAF